MRRVVLHPAWFAIIALLLGFALGVAASSTLSDYLDHRRERTRRIASRESIDGRLAGLRRADSLALRRDTTVRWFTTWPTELQRVQAGAHCAITFIFGDASQYPLFNVRMDDARTMLPLGQGWAYSSAGFARDDTVTIVIPYARCDGGVVMGGSMGNVEPRRRTRLEVP